MQRELGIGGHNPKTLQLHDCPRLLKMPVFWREDSCHSTSSMGGERGGSRGAKVYGW